MLKLELTKPSVERIGYARKLAVRDGKRHQDVVDALVERYSISVRTAERDISEMRKQLVEHQRIAAPATLEWALDNAKSLFLSARDENDWKAALDALNSIVKWTGAGAPDRVEHTVITDEDLANEFEIIVKEMPSSLLAGELEARGCSVTMPDEAEVVDG